MFAKRGTNHLSSSFYFPMTPLRLLSMDTFKRMIFLLMLGSSAHAQETPPADPPPADPPASLGAPHIIGDLPDGSPPPPSQPPPRLEISSEDIVSTRVQDLGDHTVTFQKVRPIALPPIPAPPAFIEGESLPASQRTSHEEVSLMFVGTTAYEFTEQPDQPRSFVRFWPTSQGRSESVDLWINANFLYLTGFAAFTDSTGREHSLIMSISKDKLANHDAIQSGPDLPPLPQFPDDFKASFVVMRGNPTPEELAPIVSLLELYNTEKARLKVAYLGRVAAEEERERELRENPPRKKNIVLKYWRIDQAGQQGETSKPAVIR